MAQADRTIYRSDHYVLFPDRVVEGPSTARAISRTEIVSNYPVSSDGSTPARHWKLQENIEQYPQLKTDQPLQDALYNLSLEELKHDKRADGTLSAGAQWPGVWTRDVSYSILLSLAAIEPEASRKSLLAKVKRDRIVQDTGTGGSWPVSSDRVCWSMAAWEVYLASGDRGWLRESYQVIRNSIADDEKVVIDHRVGLARGETSFLDWREQTYPRWMQPADIYESKSIGTNAVFYRTYRILGMMARELGESGDAWDKSAERIRSAVNAQLWMKDRGLYGQYLYGRVWQSVSTRTDALGNSLALLFDLPASSSDAKAMLAAQPLMAYGIPTVYPQAPNIEPYHNRSVWPFVQAFWTWAAAKQRNENGVLYGLASIDRAAALFLTNKENFVLETGRPIGTVINSDRQLWSVAGDLALVYRGLFGMRYEVDGIHLDPVIPEPLQGRKTLSHFRFRDADLTITTIGFGNHVRRAELDGAPAEPILSVNLKGAHSMVLYLEHASEAATPLHLVEDATAPETPIGRNRGERFFWDPIEEANSYRTARNGQAFLPTEPNGLEPSSMSGFQTFQAASVRTSNELSFYSEPVSFWLPGSALVFPAGSSQGSPTYVALDQEAHRDLKIVGKITATGTYSVTFRYANGEGPVNTDNKCAVRTLFVDGIEVGPIVLPQRGKDAWGDWGESNDLRIVLNSGPHTFELRFLPEDMNMDGTVNSVRIESMTAILLS